MKLDTPIVVLIIIMTVVVVILIILGVVSPPSRVTEEEAKITSCCNAYLTCVNIEGKTKEECWENILPIQENSSCSYLRKKFKDDFQSAYEECRKVSSLGTFN